MFQRDDKAIIVIFLIVIMVISPIISTVSNGNYSESYYEQNLTGRYFQYQKFRGNIESKYKYYGFMKVDTGWENSYFIEENYDEKYVREIMIGSIQATKETKDTFENIKDFSENKLNSYLDSIIDAIRLDYKLDNEVNKKEIIDIKGTKYAIVQFDVNNRGNYFYFGFTTSKKAERMIMVRTSDSLEDNEEEFLNVVNNIDFNDKDCETKTDIRVKIEHGVFYREDEEVE